MFICDYIQGLRIKHHQRSSFNEFWKKTFIGLIIENNEYQDEFCISKKITPGSLALYFEKKNESQLGAK